MKKIFKNILILLCAATLSFAVSSCERDDSKTETHDDTISANLQNMNVTAIKDQTSGEWVDLGLPSGLLWYSVNIGATTPVEYGCYFAWGETTAKEDYSPSTYIWGQGSAGNYGYTKYNFTDTLTTLEASDDVATAVLGNGARIPTKTEWQELLNNTRSEWTIVNHVYGRKYFGLNGNSIFLPAAGCRIGSELCNAAAHDGLADQKGYYCSASIYEDLPNNNTYRSYSWNMYFNGYYQYMSHVSLGRAYGGSVRAVKNPGNK